MVTVSWGVERGEWQAYMDGSADATFFHTPAWYEALAAARGYTVDCARFRFADGAEALMPLAVGKAYRGLVQRATAGLENGYGGLVATRQLTPGEQVAAFQLARRRYPTLTVVGNPHGQAAGVPDGGALEWDGTRAVAVRDPETQLGGLSSMRQRHYKAARKAGFRLEVTERPDVALVPTFYPLYAAHAAGWAYTRWVRDEAYFQALLRAGEQHLVLFRAFDAANELVGFHLVAVQGQTALQLHIATDPRFNRANPGTLLVMEALAHAHARGVATFDFLPSGRLESVRAFKESFGARPLPFARTSHESGLARLLGGAVQLASALRPQPTAA